MTHIRELARPQQTSCQLRQRRSHKILNASQHLVGRLFYPCDTASGAAPGRRPKRGVPWISSFREATGESTPFFCPGPACLS